MMTRRCLLIKRMMSMLAFLVISVGLFASAYMSQRERTNIRIVELVTTRNKLVREVEIEKNRSVPIRLPQPSISPDERSALLICASNALAMQDPDGFEAAIMDLEGSDPKPMSFVERMKSLKLQGADLFATRARKRRFEAERLLADFVSIKAEPELQPSSSTIQEKLLLMDEIRTILLSEYSADTKYAIELNKNNARATYDLARFYQDKHTRFDNFVAIQYLERTESNLGGKDEKNADFVRALLNLATLYYAVGDVSRARCYAAETIEKYKARSDQDLVDLFDVNASGNLNEPSFIEVNNQVNPERSSFHRDCSHVN